MKKNIGGQKAARAGLKNKSYRFLTVAVVFVLICIIFIVALAINQYKGPEKDYDEHDIRTVTVSGERGRIFDRNGVLLVGNKTDYDLVYEYGAMPYSRDEINESLLHCIELLSATDSNDKWAKDYFVLKGTYPDLTFVSDVGDPETDIGYYFNRFLVRNELKDTISAKDFVKLFTDRYKLSTDKYSSTQITELIRIYYDMDRIQFGSYQAYTIATGLNLEDDHALITGVREQRIEGTTLIKQTERVYYYEGYATHILGKLGKITAENKDDYEGYPSDALVGISGCELAFEEYLRGSDGTMVYKYDKQGNLDGEPYYDPAPVTGNDIYLTIDIKLQMAAEDAMADEIESLAHADAGAATAIDPNTGEVLVIASYPTYDVSQFNRALSGTYAPGSTYKVGVALAALEQGIITADTCYICNKVYPYLGGPTCLGNHGQITVSEAIRVSCNIFFYYVGHEFGLDKITPYTVKLGLGVPTGIELNEKTGTVATEEYCESIDKTWLEFDDAQGAIGQSYHTYTPLQLSVYMSTVVNHGTRYSAHLLKSVKNSQGTIVASKEEIADTVSFSQTTYDTLIAAMRSVVSSNSSLSAYFSNVDATVGGKTGTAETGSPYDNGLFSGFAEDEDGVKQIVASCVIEKGEAGSNAAKIVAAIFEEYFNNDSSHIESGNE